MNMTVFLVTCFVKVMNIVLYNLNVELYKVWFDKNGNIYEDDDDVVACLCNTIDDEINDAKCVVPFVYKTTLDVQLKKGIDIMLQQRPRLNNKECPTYYKLEYLNECSAASSKRDFQRLAVLPDMIVYEDPIIDEHGKELMILRGLSIKYTPSVSSPPYLRIANFPNQWKGKLNSQSKDLGQNVV